MEAIARGDKPKTLQTIAYISIPDSADLEFLLWDLQDAIAAYARLSGTSLPRLVALESDDDGSAADGIVFAVENALNYEAMSVVEQVRWHCRLHRHRHRSASPLPAHGPLAPTVFRSDG